MAVNFPPREYIQKTQEVISDRIGLFQTLPICIRNIINDKMWAKVNDQYGKPFKSFEAFVTHPLWEGLELSIDDLLI